MRIFAEVSLNASAAVGGKQISADPLTTVSECFTDVAIWEPWLEAQYGTGEPLP